MSEDSGNDKLSLLAKQFYDMLAANQYFSSQKKTASSLEHLAGEAVDLNKNLKAANESSTKLATSLNRLTLAAVVIAFFALSLQSYELFCAN